MPLCIFCENELTGETKPEHILLSALGGRKTTRSAICSEHNNHFGGSIDGALADTVVAFRNLLQLESGTGKPAPAIRTQNEAGERLIMRGDGTPELLQKSFEVTTRPQGGFDIRINAKDNAGVRYAVNHIAAQTGISEDEIWAQLAANGAGAHINRPVGSVQQQLKLGGEDPMRAICKAALCLLSTVVGTGPLRATSFRAVREFVLDGGDAFNRDRGSLDPRSIPPVAQIEAEFGPLFNLLIVRSNSLGRVVAHFTLFNLTAWRVVLAEEGGPADIYIALASNPLEPAVWSDEIATKFDVSFDWLNVRDQVDLLARTTARMNAALMVWQNRGQSQIAETFVKKAFEGSGVEEGDPLTTEALERISNQLAEQIAHRALGVPLERKLSSEDIGNMRAGPLTPKKE